MQRPAEGSEFHVEVDLDEVVVALGGAAGGSVEGSACAACAERLVDDFRVVEREVQTTRRR